MVMVLSYCYGLRLRLPSTSVSGRIEDPSGAVVGGASVAITNLDRNQTWTAKSDGQGWWRFSFPPAGEYQLAISHAQFRASRLKLTLSAGQALDAPVRLTLGNVEQNWTWLARPRL